MRPLEWFGRVVAPGALRLRGRGRPRWLTVLAYHRVLPAPPPDYAFDPAVIDADPAAFDRHMALVSTSCNPIDLGRLIGFLRGETDLPPNPVLVTFDDGYRDNREHALPILRHHGISAVFFISSGHIADRRVFWWDRLAYLIARSRVPVARLSYPTELVFRPGDPAGRANMTGVVLRLIKSCRGLDVERFLTGLAHALEVPWTRELESELADQTVMTWDDVRALRAAGMEVGSHTRTHRVLHTLEPAELRAELVDSRRDIEREVGAPVRSLSYPVGRSLRRLPALARAVRDAGYEVGFSAEPRSNPVGARLDPFDLARLPVDVSVSRDQLGAFLAAPELCRAW